MSTSVSSDSFLPRPLWPVKCYFRDALVPSTAPSTPPLLLSNLAQATARENHSLMRREGLGSLPIPHFALCDPGGRPHAQPAAHGGEPPCAAHGAGSRAGAGGWRCGPAWWHQRHHRVCGHSPVCRQRHTCAHTGGQREHAEWSIRKQYRASRHARVRTAYPVWESVCVRVVRCVLMGSG